MMILSKFTLSKWLSPYIAPFTVGVSKRHLISIMYIYIALVEGSHELESRDRFF